MTYTKLQEDNKGLSNYCKNCGWSGEILNNNNCIYKRNYQEDYIADNVILNKYTIFDNTLPRVSYDCVNLECATNLKDIETEKALIFKNIPSENDDGFIKNIFKLDADKIKTIIRLKLTSVLIILHKAIDKVDFINKYNSIEIEDQEQKLEYLQFVEPKKEVLYIKYDNINMKYLYICAICGTSWKKN